MNLLLWGTAMNQSLFPVLDQIRDIGFDGVEIPLFPLDVRNWEDWRRKLDDLGLERVAVAINGPSVNPLSDSEEIRHLALEQNQIALDCAEVLGANILAGPFHSALGVFTGKAASPQERQWGIQHIRSLADYAEKKGIRLALEYLNRFESYLFTCTADMLDFVREVNHPACQVMFDTFHANIEEKDIVGALHSCGKHLIHVQFSENDRSTPGAGHLDFAPIIQTLKAMDYRGMVSIEAFSMALPAAHIWRPMFTSEHQLMKDGLQHLKREGL